ncbi:IclR family transcriptional regulator [Rhodophyticola sp. CCM32]|uniref:IclR family transcriptional regulator n=1 Tax=Rhodophyticola sp. CCM32 TaxID=2916397 RepID=UPI00143D67CF|nr:IclR family transcriptional regulator [Rhodophyticola sp. CCM32]
MHLERLIRILETVAMSGGGSTVNDICAATGFPKPSIYRLVQDLVAAGLLASPEKGVFCIGQRVHRISRMDKSDAEISVIAEPLLSDLSDRFGAACFLSRLRGDGVEITQVEVPSDKAISFLHPGLGLRPMHACSCAKVIAAYADEETQTDVIGGRFRQYTDYTQTEPAALKREFHAIRVQGYGECIQELELGICSVAAPVHLDDLGVGLSVGATGSIRVFTPEFRARIGPALIALAERLAECLGHPAQTTERYAAS